MAISMEPIRTGFQTAANSLRDIPKKLEGVVSYVGKGVEKAARSLSAEIQGLPARFRSEDRVSLVSDSRNSTRSNLLERVGDHLLALGHRIRDRAESMTRRGSNFSGIATDRSSVSTQAPNAARADDYTNVEARIAHFKKAYPNCESARVEAVVTRVTTSLTTVMDNVEKLDSLGLNSTQAEDVDNIIGYLLDGEGSNISLPALDAVLPKQFARTQVPAATTFIAAVEMESRVQGASPADQRAFVRNVFAKVIREAKDNQTFMRDNASTGSDRKEAYEYINRTGKDYFASLSQVSVPGTSLKPERDKPWADFEFNADACVASLGEMLEADKVPDDLCMLYASVENGLKAGSEGKDDAEAMIKNGLNDVMFLRSLNPAITAGPREGPAKTNAVYLARLVQQAANGTAAKDPAERDKVAPALDRIRPLVEAYRTAVLERGHVLLEKQTEPNSQA